MPHLLSIESLQKSSSSKLAPFNKLLTVMDVTSTKKTYIIEEALNEMGFGKFQIKLLFVIGCYTLCESMEMTLMSIFLTALHCSWGISYWEGAGLSIVVFLGIMISSVFWGFLSDNYGRKKSLILSACIHVFYAVLSAFSPSFTWILIFRFLIGFAIGCIQQTTLLYSEFLPTNKRVVSVAILTVSFTLAACFEVVLALFIMPKYGWRWLLGLTSLPSIIFLITSIWLPESIRFDASTGNINGAIKTLKRIAKDNNKAMLQGSLIVDDFEETNRGNLLDLFLPNLRVTTLLLFFIWSVGDFCYFGIVLMSPELLQISDNEISSNISCYGYCEDLQTEDYINLLWTIIAEFPGSIITILLIEILGRKQAMQLQYISFSILMLLLAICNLSPTWVVIVLSAARGIASGVIATESFYTSEVYPTTLRATGIGVCSSLANIAALVTPIVAQVILQISVPISIGIYGGLGILAAFATFLLPIETKGRELKDSHLTL